MEPQSATSAQRLDKFTNASGSINFHLWKQLFLASAMAKGLETAFKEQDENGLTAAKLAAANKADAVLLFEILNNIDREPRQWAILNYPITEEPTQWAGLTLWNSLKKRYELKAIPQEVHLFKMQTLNLKCNGNAKAYMMDIMRKRFFQIAGDEMNKEKADIFDHDLTQAVLLNLPHRFQAFTTIFRADPKNYFEEFSEHVILVDRQMQQHQRACPMHYQEQHAMNMQPGPKWKGKEKKGKNKIGGEKSSLDSSNPILFNL